MNKGSVKHSLCNEAYGREYLNARSFHESEKVVFEGEILIERVKNTVTQLKRRYAVLCPTRLLLFQDNQGDMTFRQQKMALAVYPVINSQFEVVWGKHSSTSEEEPMYLEYTFTEQAVVRDFSATNQ